MPLKMMAQFFLVFFFFCRSSPFASICLLAYLACLDDAPQRGKKKKGGLRYYMSRGDYYNGLGLSPPILLGIEPLS